MTSKQRRTVGRPKRAHVKYAGIQPSTIERYRAAVLLFFDFLHDFGYATPNSFAELDHLAGEYINHLYLDDAPMYWAADFVSGLKRLYSRSRRQLDTATRYFDNWSKTIVRKRAAPVPAPLLMAMTALALLQRNGQLAFSLLIGFLGLMRSGEILRLTARQCSIHGGGRMLFITLPHSKGGRRRGEIEHIKIYDPAAIRLAELVLRQLRPSSTVCRGKWKTLANDINRLASHFGAGSVYFTPYCLRRGGATWHFTKYNEYDATQSLGRWQSHKTAKIYIDDATADLVLVSLPEWGSHRVARAVQALPDAIKSYASSSPPPPLEGWGQCA